MKTRTKLLTAVLSTVTALSCALTAAALTNVPTITLQGNETTPATLENNKAEVTLTLKATDFSDVAGAKLRLTLPSGITLKNATVTDVDNTWTLTKGENYTFTNNTVTFVDVFNMTGATTKSALNLNLAFTVEDTTIGKYTINVSGDFADASEDLKRLEDGTVQGVIVIGKERNTYTAENIESINSSVDVKEEFIPYGGAYTDNGDGSYTYYEKGIDGKIVFPSATSVTVLKCKLPSDEIGVTTFGASKSTFDDGYKYNTIQFGSYAKFNGEKTYGTLLVIGDFDDMVNYYLTNKSSTYKSADDVVARLMKLLDDNHIDNAKYVKFNYNKAAGKYVHVAKVVRNTYMWRNNEVEANATALQYAIRVYDIPAENTNVKYTAIAYSVGSDAKYKFSTEIKTATLAGLN